jgi:Fic family protein
MAKKLPDIWLEIEQKTRLFEALDLRLNPDYEKSALYSIVTHSTAIEGSTLTETETEILFESGLTTHGKPLLHHLMNVDLRNAYVLAATHAAERAVWTPDYLRKLNALVMKSTGGVTSVLGGDFDSSKGDFRLCGVSAGIGGKSYESHLKVPGKVDEFCKKLNAELDAVQNIKSESLQKLYEITFGAHLDLATVHPWLDGTGRTARLLMNLLQLYFKLVPTKTYSEDMEEYIASLRESQEKKDSAYFLEFMAGQHLKTLEDDIAG